MTGQSRPEVLRHMAGVVAPHLGNNKVEADAVPQLIQAVYQALSGLGAESDAAGVSRTPAVLIRRSIFPDVRAFLEFRCSVESGMAAHAARQAGRDSL